MKILLSLGTFTLLFASFVGCDVNSSAPPVTNTTASPVNSTTALPKEEAEKLIHRLATQDGCKDSTADLRLSFTDAEGKSQQMDFRLQRKYESGKVSTLMTVLSPPEESEKALLAFEEDGKPTTAISYLAGLKKVAQLKSDNPLNFRGSKSTVQEMLGMELGQYQIANTTAANGAIVIELKEKDGAQLSFPRLDVTFAEKDKTPSKFELYDGRGEKAKTIQAAELKTNQNYQAITKMEIEDHRNKQTLKLETRSIKYDTNLSASLFTEANLIKTVTAASQKQIQ
ncbi:MAG: outer membrane lipoprotein-sorting protein [Blastocatellia bacterium]|nr:outer membrane lipoprotein-sorting protein [Blastocatellia bacterium]